MYELIALNDVVEFKDRGIESLDMADHQGHAGSTSGRHESLRIGNGGSQRLLDQYMFARLYQPKPQGEMGVARRCDNRGIDCGQRIVKLARGLGTTVCGQRARSIGVRVDHPTQLRARQSAGDSGVMGAHNAGTNHRQANHVRVFGIETRPNRFGHRRSLGHRVSQWGNSARNGQELASEG